MLLKKIEIYGFKSFAERVHMKFDKGITAIVGPNGSGKSNVADAVRWVLGEQSAKSLRGARMEDIIFSGTQVRKSLGFAEVSLTLDNAEGSLPIDYTEVTITRRVFRSGDSEYYINRTACRLKDIVELFMDTGVGKEGYSIIGQGRIDEILSTRSEDRRYIFEEAAGIVKYKSRRDEAEKKLLKTRDNLTRVDDILTELAAQILPLEEQSQVAKVYLDLKEELKNLEINRFIHQYNRHTARMDELKTQVVELEEAVLDHQGQIECKEQEKEALAKRLSDMQEEAEDIRKERYDLLNEAERLKGTINLIKEKVSQFKRDEERLRSEVKDATDTKDEYQTRLSGMEEAAAKVEAELAITKDKAAAQLKGLTALEQALNRHKEEMDASKGSILKVLGSISECRNHITRYRTIEQTLGERQSKLLDLTLLRETEKAEHEAEGLKVVESVEALTLAYNEKDLSRKALEEEAADLKQQLSSMEGKIQQDKQQLEGRRSRLRLLEDMQKGYEGYNKSVREVLLACQRNTVVAHKVCGVVAELIRVPKEVETAIETVLGGALQNIVTEQEQDAKYLIEFLREHSFGRATFLPISSIRGRSLTSSERSVLRMDGCIGIASKLVRCEDKYQQIIENLLGRVLVARDLDAAIKMSKQYSYAFRIVTQKGDILNPGGSMTGGSSAIRGIGILSRSREIEELNLEMKALTEKLLRDQQLQTELFSTYRDRKQQVEEAGTALLGLDRSRTAELEKAGRIQMLKAQAEKEIASYATEAEQIAQNIAELLESIKESEETLASLEEQSGHINRTAKASEQVLMERDKEKEALSIEYADSRVQIASLDRELQGQLTDIQSLKQEVLRLSRVVSAKEVKIKTGQDEIKDQNKRLLSANQEMADIEEKAEAFLQTLATKDAARKAVEQSAAQSEQALKDIARTIAELTDKKYKLEVQFSRLEVELENYQNNIWEEYHLTYANALPFKDHALNTGQLASEITRIKSEIEVLGTVNVNAIEEYKRLKERLTFLMEQKNDLTIAKDNLKGIINDITTTMEERFKKEFAAINHYFSQTFAELFDGGKAELVLDDKSDVLSCGIDITAQPPGKKLQSLSLLSGGERALTAIAILFAILRHKPTPFCVLDEIDAALDESNVDHFSRFVQEFSKDTQFVMITHRKGTMEVCDVLYGIAMEEKGVSKLISVRFEDKVEQETA